MKQITTKFLSVFGMSAILILPAINTVQAADVQELVKPCFDCHGKDGASSEPEIPIIGGFSVPYATDTMIAYQGEERPCPKTKYLSGDKKGEEDTMCNIAKELDEKEIAAIAKYFADKPFVRAKQSFDAALAEKGAVLHEEECKKCHADGGSLASDDSGILAGQWIPYIRQAFKEFGDGDRPMVKKMKPKFKKLTPEDIEALVNYYGSFK